MTAAIFFRRLDYVLLAAIAGVIAFGSVTILSVTGAETERRHLAYVAIGVVLALAVATVDLRLYRKVLWPGYVALLLLLMVVLGPRGGARLEPLDHAAGLQPAAVRDRQGDRDRRAGGAGRRAQPRASRARGARSGCRCW